MTDIPIERQYVSQFGEDVLGLVVHVSGAPADPDDNAVLATMKKTGSTETTFSRPATRFEVGKYGVQLTSQDTSVPGTYELVFTYTIGGAADTYAIGVEVGASAPAYDALAPQYKQVVEGAYGLFADLFDSPAGGPHLQVYVQSRFGRNRMAELLRRAMGRLNTISQPQMTYSLDAGVGQPFPMDQWGALLGQALYVEIIKHLIRSYTEMPEVILGTAVSRTDRRDYQQRWMSILQLEQPELDQMLSNFKMAHMGLGRVSVLVSGGAFGRFGPTANMGGAGAAAARGYFAARYF